MITFNCENPTCGKSASEYPSTYNRKKHHFCSVKCYSEYRANVLPSEEQNAWQGGITPEESRRRWASKNAEVLRARKQARMIRELNAPGSHTESEWKNVRDVVYKGHCAYEDDSCGGHLTKDHIVPLIMNGSNDPDNLQPLCLSHNSRKSRRVHVGNFDVEAKEI